MTFKEFSKWCNERACDGCWGMKEAMICASICEDMYKKPFWKREKIWREDCEKSVVSQIVEPTNKLIEKYANDT